MKQNYRSLYLIGATLFSVFLFSCNKEVQKDSGLNPEVVAKLTTTAGVYTALSGAFDMMLSGALPGDASQVSGRKYGCASITATPGGLTGFPKQIVVDFGTEDCTLRGYNGRGSVSFTLDQWIYLPGTVIEPTFHDFYVNGYKIEGTYKVTTESATKFKVEIIEGIITSPDDIVFTLSGLQYYEQVEGADTELVFGDDVFEITGNVEGISSLGHDTKGEIKTPLIKRVDCANVVSGVMYLEVAGSVGDLDFGNGVCDNIGILKTEYLGQVFEFEMELPF